VQDGQTFVVVDDSVQGNYAGMVSGWAGNPLWQKFPGHGHVGKKSRSIVFSPDSRHVVYAANDAGHHIMVLDGREKARHPAILNQPPCFSPDSEHLAYGIEEGPKQRLVLDAELLSPHDGRHRPSGASAPTPPISPMPHGMDRATGTPWRMARESCDSMEDSLSGHPSSGMTVDVFIA
jgi:hypothetical protein